MVKLHIPICQENLGFIFRAIFNCILLDGECNVQSFQEFWTKPKFFLIPAVTPPALGLLHLTANSWTIINKTANFWIIFNKKLIFGPFLTKQQILGPIFNKTPKSWNNF